jgi:hypothetical protein
MIACAVLEKEKINKTKIDKTVVFRLKIMQLFPFLSIKTFIFI